MAYHSLHKRAEVPVDTTALSENRVFFLEAWSSIENSFQPVRCGPPIAIDGRLLDETVKPETLLLAPVVAKLMIPNFRIAGLRRRLCPSLRRPTCQVRDLKCARQRIHWVRTSSSWNLEHAPHLSINSLL